MLLLPYLLEIYLVSCYCNSQQYLYLFDRSEEVIEVFEAHHPYILFNLNSVLQDGASFSNFLLYPGMQVFMS